MVNIGDIMITFIQLFITGISVGCVYGLIAIGFVLIYKSSKIFNFAIGEMVMVGAYLMWVALVYFNLPLFLSFIAVFLVVGIAGYGLERFPLRRMIGQPILAAIMVTMGIAIFLRGMAVLLWAEKIGIKYTPVIKEMTIAILNIPFSNISFLSLLFVLLLVIILGSFFIYSRLGLYMRAAAENQQVAQSMGIKVTSAVAQSWAIAAIVSSIGGFLLGYVRGIDYGLADIGLIAMCAALVGGLESFKGAIWGGIIIGVFETLTGGYIGHGLKEVVPFIIMLGVLIIKPYGLFGLEKIERV